MAFSWFCFSGSFLFYFGPSLRFFFPRLLKQIQVFLAFVVNWSSFRGPGLVSDVFSDSHEDVAWYENLCFAGGLLRTCKELIALKANGPGCSRTSMTRGRTSIGHAMNPDKMALLLNVSMQGG